MSTAPSVPELDVETLREQIRDVYRAVAATPDGAFHFATGRALAEHLGYPARELDVVPGAVLASFAGVGYALDLAGLRPGQRVLDLGCGSGTDAFIVAHAVGPAGRVVGVDMTDGQLAKARAARDRRGLPQLDLVAGLVEQPPVEDASVDAVISNGVVNLVPDEPRSSRPPPGHCAPGAGSRSPTSSAPGPSRSARGPRRACGRPAARARGRTRTSSPRCSAPGCASPRCARTRSTPSPPSARRGRRGAGASPAPRCSR